jgi:hypothetical protein
MFDQMPEAPAELVEAVFIASLPQQANELPNPVGEDAERHDGQEPQDQHARETENGDLDRIHSHSAFPRL